MKTHLFIFCAFLFFAGSCGYHENQHKETVLPSKMMMHVREASPPATAQTMYDTVSGRHMRVVMEYSDSANKPAGAWGTLYGNNITGEPGSAHEPFETKGFVSERKQ